MAPTSALPGQRPPKPSTIRQHATLKPYSRPAGKDSGAQQTAGKAALTPASGPPARSIAGKSSDGIFAGLKSLVSAPLGWLGLSGGGGAAKGASSSSAARASSVSADSSSFRKRKATTAALSPPPTAPPTSRSRLGDSTTVDMEEGNAVFAPPSRPSTAAQRYALPSSASVPYYLDAPVINGPTHRQQLDRSSRATSSSISSSRQLLAPSSSATKGVGGGMTRSATSTFPSLSSSASFRDLRLAGRDSPVAVSSSDRWAERYARRDELSPAPEPSLARSVSSAYLDNPVPSYLRPAVRSSSLLSLTKSAQGAGAHDEVNLELAGVGARLASGVD